MTQTKKKQQFQYDMQCNSSEEMGMNHSKYDQFPSEYRSESQYVKATAKNPNLGRSLSVKCSTNSLSYMKNLFKEDARFVELKRYGVVLNPSWFFKFSANYTLQNFSISDEIKNFAYQSHYTNFFDKNLQEKFRYLSSEQ